MSVSYTFEVLAVIGGCFAFAFGTYFVFAAGAYQVFWVWKKDRYEHKRIQKASRRAPAVKREIALSFVTASIFAVMLGGFYVLTDIGLTQIYYRVADGRVERILRLARELLEQNEDHVAACRRIDEEA